MKLLCFSAVSCSRLSLQCDNKDERLEDPKIISTSAPASTNCLLGNFEVNIIIANLCFLHHGYGKIPKFSDVRKPCFNLPNIKKKKRPNIRVFLQKDANVIANSEDLGLHCLPRPICPKTLDHFCIYGGVHIGKALI